jgi:hypothetical protein
MAWVGPYVENYYGSGLTVRLEGSPFGGAVVGSYAPPCSGQELVRPGKAELRGTYALDAGKIVLVGTWHTEGPLTHGDFEMRSLLEAGGASGKFEGWWRSSDEPGRHAWCWEKLDTRDSAPVELRRHVRRASRRPTTVRFEGVELANLQVPLDQGDATPKDKDEWTTCDLESGKCKPAAPQEACTEVTPRSQKSEAVTVVSQDDDLSCSDKMALLVASVKMERYGMLCAWLFFAQTLGQLLSAHYGWALHTPFNVACNAVYSVTYLSFLAAYGVMMTPPDSRYVGGVALYFLGYAVFLSLYVRSFLGLAGGAGALYHAGSWLFLSGSALLLVATAPPQPAKGSGPRFSPHLLGASLWWGSLMFFVGSAFFCADAAGYGWISGGNVTAGLVTFTLGRLFFVRGSQTRRCDFLFRSQTSQARLHRRLTRRPTFSLLRRNTRVFGGVMPAGR